MHHDFQDSSLPHAGKALWDTSEMSGAHHSSRAKGMLAVLPVPATVCRQGNKAGQWREDDECAQDSNEPVFLPL